MRFLNLQRLGRPPQASYGRVALFADGDGTVKTVDQHGNVETVGSGAPPGGAQLVRVYGPFSYDYTDFATEGAEYTIFTPDAGDVIVMGFGDSTSAVNFDDSGSIDFAIGETPDFNAGDYSGGFWGFLGGSVQDGGGFPNHYASNSNANPASGSVIAWICTGAPIKIKAVSVVGDGAAGHMDLYFVVATPTLP